MDPLFSEHSHEGVRPAVDRACSGAPSRSGAIDVGVPDRSGRSPRRDGQRRRRRACGRHRRDPARDRCGRGRSAEGRWRRRLPAIGSLPDLANRVPALGRADVRCRADPPRARAWRRHARLRQGYRRNAELYGRGPVSCRQTASVATHQRARQRRDLRRHLHDLLFRACKRRFRNRQRQWGRGCSALPRRPARLSAPHRLSPRLRFRRDLSGRKRGGQPALLWRALRHRDGEDIAGVAIHADRFGVLGPARRRDPRA